jgi:DNA-binding CsgD family transcriptional regulator/tetratricopeptide (TPR) repeat protein
MTLREYGVELLEASGESSELRRRQRDHYLARAAAMVALWCGPDQAERLAAARRDHANLLSALDWSASTPGEELAGTRLAALLRYHWIAGGNLSDGRRWLDRMLTLSTEPSPERAEALWSAAWVCLIQGDRDAAQRYLVECRRIAKQLDDRVLAADADHWTALYELFSGRVDEAIALFRAAIEVHLEVGDKASALTAMFQLAMAQTYTDSPEDALATCREVLRESDEYGERWNYAYAHWAAGLCHWHLGQFDEARQSQISALEILRDFLDGICTAVTIEQLSWMAASNEHYESAAVLFHAAQGVWKGLGTTMSAFGPHIQADSEQMAARVRRELGESRFEAILASSAVPSKAEAIELALTAARTAHVAPKITRRPLPPPSLEADAPGALGSSHLALIAPSGLTKREAQVAALVAEGRSNKEIAATLVISRRTVDGHVEHILTKLGFTSRTQIAVWFAELVGLRRTTAR